MIVLTEELRKLGFTQTEAKIYLYLLDIGIATPPQIAKGTGVSRPNLYGVLRSLKEKGLLEEQHQHKRLQYFTRDPQALLQTIKLQQEKVEQLLPKLHKAYNSQQNKPIMRFYEGFEEVKNIFWQTLQSKEIYGIASTQYLFKHDLHFSHHFQQEVQKRGIVFYDILTHQSRGFATQKTKDILRGLYDTRYLPKKFEDTPTDILVWDNYVAIMNISEQAYGVLLTDKYIASTFKTMFKLLWEYLKDV